MWASVSDIASKPQVLVICPPDDPLVRKLDPLRGLGNFQVSNEPSELLKLAPAAEIIFFAGMASGTANLSELWPHATSLRWIHSLGTGVEKTLFPALIESAIPLTNARGVFKRSLAEFAILGFLFHTKRVRRLIDNQRAHRWDDFTVRFADKKVMGIVGFGGIGRECALLAKGLGLSIHALQRSPKPQDPLIDRAFGAGRTPSNAPWPRCPGLRCALDRGDPSHDRGCGT